MRDEDAEFMRRGEAGREEAGRGDAGTRGRGEDSERDSPSDGEPFIHSSKSVGSASRSEFDLIRKLRRRALKQIESQSPDSPALRVPASPRPRVSSSSLRTGLGDDAAVIRQ